MKSAPKVSVLIPTYNAAAYLNEAIQSVLDQTFSDFELIIVDNCSSDNTCQVVANYLTDPRITYKKNEINIGPINNFNRCLELANGEYIKFLCADDKFYPDLLEKFVSIMDTHPTVSLVTSFSQGIGLNSRVWKPPFQHLQDGKKIIHKVLEQYNWIGCPTQVMFRRSNLWVGKFRDLICMADVEMWMRHLSIGDCYIIPEILSYGRDHADSITQKQVMKSYTMAFEAYDLCKAVKNRNEYKLNLSEVNINKVLKTKAISCALVIPHALLKNRKNANISLIKKSVKVAYRERVLLYSTWLIAVKVFTHLLPLGAAANHLPEAYG
jgi:glycosyltransferase involved in cell wall biosynthesis